MVDEIFTEVEVDDLVVEEVYEEAIEDDTARAGDMLLTGRLRFKLLLLDCDCGLKRL